MQTHKVVGMSGQEIAIPLSGEGWRQSRCCFFCIASEKNQKNIAARLVRARHDRLR